MTLGTKLYNLRNSRKITLDALSLKLELSKTAIGKWEADKAKPSVENLLKICDYYETDIYKLLEEVSNINFSGAKFKGNSYAAYAENFTVNNNTSQEVINKIIDNQNNISNLIKQQSDFIIKLLNNKLV